MWQFILCHEHLQQKKQLIGLFYVSIGVKAFDGGIGKKCYFRMQVRRTYLYHKNGQVRHREYGSFSGLYE